ncbi:MAG: hypothetical protein GY795_18230 [Desulfobacterales bacterium]|nr:hypothetical protein [Desulfobacterales bacterium]
MKHFRKKWPWNDEYLRAFLIVPSLIGIVAAAAAACYISAGVHSLWWFLLAVLTGIVFRLIYGMVGKRITDLKAEYIEDSGEVVEGLLVIGNTQSPGLVILRSSELVLIPIVGDKWAIPLNEVEVLKQGRMLPGKYVYGKRAFILKSHLKKRLAFAVEETIGERWSRIFARPY